MGGVHHVDDPLRAVDEIDRHARRFVERLEGIGARRVHDGEAPAGESHAARRVTDRGARVVGGDGAHAGEPGKEHALPDVRLADEENVGAHGVPLPG